MADKIFPEGIRVFKPHDNAPEFVKAELSIDAVALASWLKTNGKPNVKLTLKQSQKGSYYLEVNTYEGKAEAKAESLSNGGVTPQDIDLPF